MDETLRVGIIGCGNVTLKGHARILNALEGVSVAAIADPTESRREAVRALLDLPPSACFADHRRLLESQPAYVVLAVPPKFRRAIVEDCARAGVHVLSEKPIATSPGDARAMIGSMRASQLLFGMVHNYLFYPEYRLARELVAAGAIGRLRNVTLNFLGVPDSPGAPEYRPLWRHDPAESGGGILMDMIHAVYVAEFLMAEPIRTVSAVVDNLDHPGNAVEDFTLVNLYFDAGYATLNMWWGNGAGGVELSGTDGRIMIFYDDYGTGPFAPVQTFTLVNKQGRRNFDPRADQPAASTFVHIHRDFAEAVRTKREPIAPAEEGLRALEAALAAYMSAATGRVVMLPLPTDGPVFQRGVLGLRDMTLWTEGPLARRGLFGLKGLL